GSRTLLASLVVLCGVVIIVGGLGTPSDILGLSLACSMVLAIGAMTVALRRYKQTPMVAAAAWSNFLGSAISVPFAHDIASPSAIDLWVFAAFGFLQVGMGLTLYVLGSRLLPSTQASLIATLESPLMPFWVWLAFREVPPNHALVGGALVMGAVITDIVGDQHRQAIRSSPLVPKSARSQERLGTHHIASHLLTWRFGDLCVAVEHGSGAGKEEARPNLTMSALGHGQMLGSASRRHGQASACVSAALSEGLLRALALKPGIV